MTLSEELFEEFCRRVGIQFERLSAEAERTPDYDIFLADLRVVVEVKEVDPVLPGPTGVTSFTIGKAIRHDLKKAGKQVKARAKHELPGMIVLFEKQRQQLGSSSIRHAMYGEHTVDIRVPTDRSESPTLVGHYLGGNRQLTPEHNTSIGIVAHLDRDGPDELSLTAYHNRHAFLPIPPERLACYGMRQYTLPDVEDYRIPEWQEIEV